MRLDCAVMEDVTDCDAALSKAARHQETAMAIERFTLGAQQTNARPRRDFAIAFTPALCSSATKRSTGMFEWPMLKTSHESMLVYVSWIAVRKASETSVQVVKA
jgi:hypothetical protein